MTCYLMGDSFDPPPIAPDMPAYAFYAGGQTPAPWTPAQVAALPCRWVLPIWVAIDPSRDAARDAGTFAEVIGGMGWKPGTALAVDTEGVVMADWLARFDDALGSLGHTLIHYEDRLAGPSNPPTSGGKWIPTWDDKAAMAPGAVATQYATAAMADVPWDLSIIDASVPLHELNPAQTAGTPWPPGMATLPVLSQGTAGWAVRMLQALLLAAMPHIPRIGLDDGIFGPVTSATLREWQFMYGVTDPLGSCGPATWQSLLTRQ